MVLKVGDQVAIAELNPDHNQSVSLVNSRPTSHTSNTSSLNLGDDEDDGDGSPVLELPDSIEKDLFAAASKTQGLTVEQRAELVDDEGYDASEEEGNKEGLTAEVHSSDEVSAVLDGATFDAENDRVDLDNYDNALDSADKDVVDQETELDLSNDDDEDDDADEEEQADDLELSDDENDEQAYQMPDLAEESSKLAYVQAAQDDTEEDNNELDELDELDDESAENIEDEAVVLADGAPQGVKALNSLSPKPLSLSPSFFCDKTKRVHDLLVRDSYPSPSI